MPSSSEDEDSDDEVFNLSSLWRISPFLDDEDNLDNDAQEGGSGVDLILTPSTNNEDLPISFCPIRSSSPIPSDDSLRVQALRRSIVEHTSIASTVGPSTSAVVSPFTAQVYRPRRVLELRQHIEFAPYPPNVPPITEEDLENLREAQNVDLPIDDDDYSDHERISSQRVSENSRVGSASINTSRLRMEVFSTGRSQIRDPAVFQARTTNRETQGQSDQNVNRNISRLRMGVFSEGPSQIRDPTVFQARTTNRETQEQSIQNTRTNTSRLQMEVFSRNLSQVRDSIVSHTSSTSRETQEQSAQNVNTNTSRFRVEVISENSINRETQSQSAQNTNTNTSRFRVEVLSENLYPTDFQTDRRETREEPAQSTSQTRDLTNSQDRSTGNESREEQNIIPEDNATSNHIFENPNNTPDSRFLLPTILEEDEANMQARGPSREVRSEIVTNMLMATLNLQDNTRRQNNTPLASRKRRASQPVFNTSHGIPHTPRIDIGTSVSPFIIAARQQTRALDTTMTCTAASTITTTASSGLLGTLGTDLYTPTLSDHQQTNTRDNTESTVTMTTLSSSGVLHTPGTNIYAVVRSGNLVRFRRGAACSQRGLPPRFIRKQASRLPTHSEEVLPTSTSTVHEQQQLQTDSVADENVSASTSSNSVQISSSLSDCDPAPEVSDSSLIITASLSHEPNQNIDQVQEDSQPSTSQGISDNVGTWPSLSGTDTHVIRNRHRLRDIRATSAPYQCKSPKKNN